MEFKKLTFLLLLIVFTIVIVSCSSGETGFFEKVWQQDKVIVIIAVILIILILVVLKISLFPSTGAKEPTLVPEKELEKAAAQEDKTKAADETVMESEIAGTLTVTVKGEELGTFDITTTPIIVGRDPKSDVVIKSETVSKSHLKIIPQSDQFSIVDLGSTNGTYVNGEKITETLVTPDDMVQLGKRGNIKLIFKK